MSFWLPDAPLAEMAEHQPRVPSGPKGGQWTKGGSPVSGGDAAVIPKIPWAEIDTKSFSAAGGSNGAKFGRKKTGEKILVKRYGGNERRVATELAANAVYRHLGFKSPRMGYTRGPDGKRAVAYELMDGEVRKGWTAQGPSKELSKGFVADAFLGNWDVVGLEDDNTLWDAKSGDPIRLDPGGSLEFRAMGAKKPYGPVPDWAMLERSQVKRAMTGLDDQELRRQSAVVGAAMTDGVIDGIIDAAKFPSASQAARIRANMKARAKWLREYGAGQRNLPGTKAPLNEQEGAIWLSEMPIPGFHWDEGEHPRNVHGKFVEKVDALSFGAGVSLDSKTFVKKDKDGTYRVVRSGGIIKGFPTAADAARAALDRSVKGKEGDGVGGGVSYKDFNAYLKARGVSEVDTSAPNSTTASFGGKQMTKTELTQEANRLLLARQAAQLSGDKYQERAVATYDARRQEALAKAGQLKDGGIASTSPSPFSPPTLAPAPTPAPAPSAGLKFEKAAVMPSSGSQYKKLKAHYDVKDAQGNTIGSIQHVQHMTPVMNGSIQVAMTNDFSAWYFKKPGEQGNGKQAWTLAEAKGHANAHQVAQMQAGAAAAKPAPGMTGLAPSPVAPSLKKFGKNEKQTLMHLAQPNSAGVNVGPSMKQLDLAPGDKVQMNKGGHIYTVTDTSGPYTKATGPSGSMKNWAGYQKPYAVIKADKTAVKLKAAPAAPAAPTPTPTAPAAPTPPPPASAPEWAALHALKWKKNQGELNMPASDLAQGVVIKSPSGKLLVKTGADATDGYTAFTNLQTKAKVEVPNGSVSSELMSDPVAKAHAQHVLKSGTSAGAASTGAGAPVSAPKPPPPPPPPKPVVPGENWDKELVSGGGLSQSLTSQQVPHFSKLSSAARSAISDYTSSGYSAMNSQLRAKTPVGNAHTEQKIMNMDKAFHEIPGLAKDSLLWRGVNGKTGDAYKADAQVGSIIRDHGYTSTSTSESFAAGWGTTLLKIKMPAGSKGLWVDAPGGGNLTSVEGEKEFIVPHGMVMKVVHRRVRPGGQVELTCEVVSGNVL